MQILSTWTLQTHPRTKNDTILHMGTRILIGLSFAGLSIVGFASTFIFGAALTRGCGVSPEVLSFLRFAIAGLVLLVTGASTQAGRNALLGLSRREWLSILWIGPVGTALMAWCVFMGCARVSAANASMADALTPLMIFSVAALKNRRLSLRELLGLLLGFAGALLVIQVITLNGLALAAYSTGDVFVLLAAATWAIYTVYGRRIIGERGSLVFSAWTMLVGAMTIGLVLPFGSFSWPETSHAWIMTISLGLVSTLMPFWAWNAAQNYLSMTVLGVSAYFTPVAAVAMALLFLGESASLLQWLGTIVIVISALCTSSYGGGGESRTRVRNRINQTSTRVVCL